MTAMQPHALTLKAKRMSVTERGPEGTCDDRTERRREEQWPRPRIYVASLSDYNEGRLHGAWIDACRSEEELAEAVAAMLAQSPCLVAEEWAIHDYEDFAPLRLHEFDSLAYVAKVAAGIARHGRAFAAWADEAGSEPELLDEFEDRFLGNYESGEAFAREMIDDWGVMDEVLEQLPAELRPYVQFDHEAFFRDLVAGGEITTAESAGSDIYVFRNA